MRASDRAATERGDPHARTPQHPTRKDREPPLIPELAAGVLIRAQESPRIDGTSGRGQQKAASPQTRALRCYSASQLRNDTCRQREWRAHRATRASPPLGTWASARFISLAAPCVCEIDTATPRLRGSLVRFRTPGQRTTCNPRLRRADGTPRAPRSARGML